MPSGRQLTIQTKSLFQDIFGMQITVVRDGLGWSDQLTNQTKPLF
jgi:hypothetical protein